MRNFPTFHCHPQSLDSASTPEAFAAKEVELGTGTLTCTDHGTLGAVYKTYSLAKKNNLTPICGTEGYFRDSSCPILTKLGVNKTGTVPRGMDKDEWALKHPQGTFYDYSKYFHLTLGFKTYQAYLTGVKLLSKADARAELHGSERKALFDWDDLEELAATETTLGSGCLVGMVGRHLINEDVSKETKVAAAIAYFNRMRHLFGDRFFVEVFPHVCSHNHEKGIFLKVQNSKGVQDLKYHFRKVLRTNKEELRAEELADQFNGKDEIYLTAISNYRVWQDFEEPLKVLEIRKQDGFIQNECTPNAPNGDVQWGVNKFVMGMAKRYNIPILVSDDSHFTDPSQKIVQDVRLAQSGTLRFFGSYHRQSSAEAFSYFNTQHNISEKEFESWVDNAYNLVEGFKGFKFKNEIQLPTKFFPTDTLAHTRELINKHGRMPKDNPVYLARLKKEIDLFHKNGTVDLLPYFWVDEEVCELYSNEGLLTGCGRGSAGGTLLAYLLGITHIDPIKYDLSLERFLTLDRIKSHKLPDIDLDLPSRDLLCEWLPKRYGDHFAQISITSTLRLKNAVKDVARAIMGSVPPDIEGWTTKFEPTPQGLEDIKFIMGYENDEGIQQGSIERDQALQAYVNRYPDQWKIVKMALALPRQKGRHASAFIIANEPISNFIPVTTVSGVKVTDFVGTEVEAMGCLKMDWLVIKILNDIQSCLKLVAERNQIPLVEQVIDGKKVPAHRLVLDPVSNKLVDCWDLPSNMDVFRDISSSKTETVFQFCTPSAIQWLKQFDFTRPNGEPAINSIEAMAAFTALDRPGTLNFFVTNPDNPSQKHNVLVEYARRVKGENGSPDILPVFEKLLPKTYSLMVFQEDIQKVYKELTGCSLAEAEEFRSNVAKKKKEKIDAAYSSFIEKVTPKLGEEQAKGIWEAFISWSAYGFNCSHATAYCVISYTCAWLKHHYSLEWWCSVLKNAPKDEINEKFWPYVADIVDLPDIKLSKPTWAIVDGRIRAPIDLCFGIGEAAHDQLVAGAPYESGEDFAKRIVDYKIKNADTEGKWGRSPITNGTIYTLLVAGVLDSLFDPNKSIGERMSEYHSYSKKYHLDNGKKLGKLKGNYTTPDALGRYQAKKSVLPAYSEDIRCILPENDFISKSYGQTYFNHLVWDRFENAEVIASQQLVGLDALKGIKYAVEMPQGGFQYGVAGYVEDIETFNYDKKTKTAVKFLVDICGLKEWIVQWPDKENKIPDAVKAIQKESVIVATLYKNKIDKSPSIKAIKVVRAPYKERDDEEPKVLKSK